jgi:hypothetical protein
VELSGLRTLFLKIRRGKLEFIINTILYKDSIIIKDFVLALKRDNFLNCDKLDFSSFLDFFPCPLIFSNVFKFSFIKWARFKGLLALVLIDLLSLRFQL